MGDWEIKFVNLAWGRTKPSEIVSRPSVRRPISLFREVRDATYGRKLKRK